jgi:hypothetical protein
MLNIPKWESQPGWKVPQLFVELNSRMALHIIADNTYPIYEHEHKNQFYSIAHIFSYIFDDSHAFTVQK